MLRALRMKDPEPSRLRNLDAVIEQGALAGTASAVVTCGLLALVGAIKGSAILPFYAIISILAPAPLEIGHAAMRAGDAVPLFQFELVGGIGICVVLGGISGAIFVLGTRNYVLDGVARYAVGALHGVLLMCFFYLVCLQLLGGLLGAEPEARSLTNFIGWPAMVLIHVAHGIVIARVSRSRLVSDDRRGGVLR